jgi:hypothetical protein
MSEQKTPPQQPLQKGEEQSSPLGPSPSLLHQVKQYWKQNLPKAYSQMSAKDFELAVRQAQDQIADLVSQGYSLSGAREVAYPSLFPQPEKSQNPDPFLEEEEENQEQESS